jgi:competence protein ComEC
LVAGEGNGPRERGSKLKRDWVLAGIVPCLWLGWVFWPPANAGHACVVHVLSVGSGSAVLVTTPEQHALLYDVGTIHNFDAGETAVQAARALGVRRLDALVLSHANFDYSGTPTILNTLPTGRLLFSPYFEPAATDSPAVGQLLDLLPAASPPRSTLSAGDRFTLGAATIEVLWPAKGLDERWECNDRSVVLRLEANGRSVLLPGDIERDALRALLERHESGRIDLRSDVLIAPHHGAVVPRDTTAFYAAVAPRVVVCSTSHERAKLLEMLRETLGQNVRLISTHDAGAITIRTTRAGKIEIETPFAPRPGPSPRSE